MEKHPISDLGKSQIESSDKLPMKESPMSTLETRIDELEMRIAHQDQTLSDLNDVITAQWKKIEMLERQLQRFGEELDALEAGDAPDHQKPPHY